MPPRVARQAEQVFFAGGHHDHRPLRTLGDLVRRGRHFGLEVHVLTQRVTPRADLEVGIVIPVGCMVPLAIAAAALVMAGVLVGLRYQSDIAVPTDRVTVHVIDDGATGGPRVLSTQIVPLR
jgi:hypothetical protein